MKMWDVLKALYEDNTKVFEDEWGMRIGFRNGVLTYLNAGAGFHPIIIRIRTENCPFEDLEYEWIEVKDSKEPKGLDWEGATE